LAYLLLDEFASGPAEDISQLKARCVKFKALRYVAQFWDHHVNMENTHSVQDIAINFLSNEAKRNNMLQLRKLRSDNIKEMPEFILGLSPLHVMAGTSLKGVCRRYLDLNCKLDPLDKGVPGSRSESKRQSGEILIDVNFRDTIGLTALMYAVEMGDEDIVNMLLGAGADPNLQEELRGETALHMAARRGDSVSVIQMLLDAHVDAGTRSYLGWTALHIAAGNCNDKVVETLIAQMPVNTQDIEGREALGLMLSVILDSRNGSKGEWNQKEVSQRIIRMMVEANLDIDRPIPYGWSLDDLMALHYNNFTIDLMPQILRDRQGVKSEVYLPSLSWAALFGLEDIVEVLLAAGADPELIHEGFAPLHRAVTRGQTKVVRVLIAHGVDLEKGDQKYGLSPLHWSLLVGWVDVMDLLLEAGANQTAMERKVFDFMGIWSDIAIGRDEDPFTMFIVAASNWRGKAVKLLLDLQADMNAQREDGSTALIVAAGNGHSEVVNMLLELKADMNVQDNNGVSALIGAAENGHVEVVKCLLEAQADVNAQKKDGSTALILAAAKGRGDVVEMLLEAKADVTIFGGEGRTALFVAAQNGHVEVAKSLLDAHANVTVQDKDGWTAFHCAAENGHVEVVKLLLDAQVDAVTFQDKDGWTAFHFAAENGHVEVVKLLLDAQMDAVTVQHKDGWTALHLAAEYGHVEVVKLLLDAHADVALQSQSGWTSLHDAASAGHVEVAKLLLDAHADVALQSKSGRTSLHAAARNGHIEVVKLFLDAQADVVTVQDKDGWTALHLAAENGHVEVVKLLLDAHADVALQSKSGWTSLHAAAWNRHIEVVKLLLDEQADVVAVQDRNGYTAFHAAVGNRHLEVVKLLLPAYVEVTVPDTTALPSSGHPTFADRLGLLQFFTDLYPSDHVFHEFLGDWHLASASTSLASKSYDLWCILNPINAHILQANDIILTHRCNHCAVYPIRGIMQRCTKCDDYDLCQKCSTMTPHPHADHEFIQIPSDECVARLGNRP